VHMNDIFQSIYGSPPTKSALTQNRPTFEPRSGRFRFK
jgi:hypothetical protein